MWRRVIVTVLLVVLYAPGMAAEIYLWPLRSERRLSSSFGEFREGHYHAGIDLRTYGRRGLPCLAVDNGQVSRIRIAPTGYGKALYLRLDDGRTAVYAHLHSFSRSLDSLTYHHRLENGSSWCDLTLAGGVYRFTVGDTVAYTGATGTEAPHLHFELRDEAGRPFNPLERLYGVPDDRPPIISGLAVFPATVGSVVGASPLPVALPFRAAGGTRYVLSDTLQLDGRFGFGVSIWDEQSRGRYRMAPYTVEIFVDGHSLYRLTNSTFAYSQTREILLEYVEVDGARYHVLFERSGQTRTDRGGAGIIGTGTTNGLALGTGLHHGEIVARDASGNESRAHFYFMFHRFPVIETARKLAAASEVILAAHDPDGGDCMHELFESVDGGDTWYRVTLDTFGSYLRGRVKSGEDAVYRYVVTDEQGATVQRHFAGPSPRRELEMVYSACRPEIWGGRCVLHITTDRMLAAAPAVRLFGGERPDTAYVHPVGRQEHIAFFDPKKELSGDVVFHVSGTDHRGYPLKSFAAARMFVLCGGGSSAVVLSDSLVVTFTAPAVWEKAICVVRGTSAPGAAPHGCRAYSQPYLIDFEPARFARPLELRCETGRKTGLFRWREGKGWKCIGVPWMAGGAVKIDQRGVYAFFDDNIPPYFRHAAIDKIPTGSGFFKTYVISVPVEEKGSGIDAYTAEAYLGGSPVVCEWDDFRERLLVPVPASVAPGGVTLRIELSDRSGNRSAGEYSFVIE